MIQDDTPIKIPNGLREQIQQTYLPRMEEAVYQKNAAQRNKLNLSEAAIFFGAGLAIGVYLPIVDMINGVKRETPTHTVPASLSLMALSLFARKNIMQSVTNQVREEINSDLDTRPQTLLLAFAENNGEDYLKEQRKRKDESPTDWEKVLYTQQIQSTEEIFADIHQRTFGNHAPTVK